MFFSRGFVFRNATALSAHTPNFLLAFDLLFACDAAMTQNMGIKVIDSVDRNQYAEEVIKTGE